MSEWITCPKCGALMIGFTGGHICPLCGYRVPVYTVTSNTGTSSEYVQVIRCKDCALNGTDDCSMHFEDGEKVYQWNRENDFCSWAERKDNG